MALSFSIDQSALGLVHEAGSRGVLGTAFSFMRPNWVVTAKHVVIDYGIPRNELQVSSIKGVSVTARVLFAHPQVDLAVLELDSDFCTRPLFPGHHSLLGSDGLICVGYAPSQSSTGNQPVLFVNKIASFTAEVRERSALNEEVIVFDAPFSEGGHSGGPIFGSGGGVVGVVIENFRVNGEVKARATHLLPLVNHLSFA